MVCLVCGEDRETITPEAVEGFIEDHARSCIADDRRARQEYEYELRMGRDPKGLRDQDW